MVLLHVDAVLLHAARSTSLGTGQVFEACDGLFAAQVNYEEVGERSTLDGLPVGRFLQVEHLVAGVVTVLVLRVGIFRRPGFTAQSLSVAAEGIDFGDGGDVAAVVGGEGFEAEQTSALGCCERDFLPSVACGEAAGGSGCVGVEVGLVADVVVLVRLLQLQFVEFGFSLSPDHTFIRFSHVRSDCNLSI